MHVAIELARPKFKLTVLGDVNFVQVCHRINDVVCFTMKKVVGCYSSKVLCDFSCVHRMEIIGVWPEDREESKGEHEDSRNIFLWDYLCLEWGKMSGFSRNRKEKGGRSC